ncbi:MAG: hypothetical protein A3H48_04705 [Candidatus Rokubacteria bacterium RIFCSPLOWO2_02_FULL_71_18]|nr:MAG: hypothetical protein A3H48_04705 [Candidatus Rokubacteria bacterium RIFCSPLOWO2_02_FULL_71_18]
MMCSPFARTKLTSFFSRLMPILSSVLSGTRAISLPVSTRSFGRIADRVLSTGFSILHFA